MLSCLLRLPNQLTTYFVTPEVVASREKTDIKSLKQEYRTFLDDKLIPPK